MALPKEYVASWVKNGRLFQNNPPIMITPKINLTPTPVLAPAPPERIAKDNVRKGEMAVPVPQGIDDGSLLKSIAIVQTDKAVGTGFICRSANEVCLLSNQHIILGANKISLTDSAGKPLDYDKFSVSKHLDLVKFTLSANAADSLPASTGLWLAEKAPVIHDLVLVLGNSQGAGVITELRGKVLGLGPDKIEVDAKFVEGNSGSPILDEEGKVLGVATYATLNTPTNWVNAGTRFNAVRRFGLRLEKPEWLVKNLQEYCAETHHLEDTKTVLNEYAYFVYTSLDIHGESGHLRKPCIERLLSYDRQIEQPKYHDPAQAQYMVNISNCMKMDKMSLYPLICGSKPDMSQRRTACNRLLNTLKNEAKKARSRLNTQYSTQFLNDSKDEMAAFWDVVDAAVSRTVYQQIMDKKSEPRFGRPDFNM